jgi:uncharacterized protein YgiM (DUF1202 family)
MAWHRTLRAALLAGALASPALAEEPVPPKPEEVPAPAPGPTAVDPYAAVTKGDDVRVRAGPSVNYRVLERLPKGAWVVVVGTDGEFSRVRIPGGVPVYVFGGLVEPKDGGKAVVARSDVLLRPTPGQEYFPLEGQKLQKGDELTVLGKEAGEKGEWLRVLPPDRVEYYVHGSLLERVAAAGEKASELERVASERRDAYTGGTEAVARKESSQKMEVDFRKMVEEAAAALQGAPADGLPGDSEKRRQDLTQVMTESGDPVVRGRAADVSKEYLERERVVLVTRARAETAAVRGELERRLAEVEAQYQARLAELLKASGQARGPRFQAIGTVRKGLDGYSLVKGEVVLHRIESLRYDLDELVGLRIGVNGKEVVVDRAQGLTLFRVDALEILE